MDTLEMPVVEAASSSQEVPSNRVVEVRVEDARVCCVCASGTAVILARVVGSHVRPGDELLVAGHPESRTAATEVLIRKPALRRADLYHASAGYAARPQPDRRGEMFVRVEVVGGALGIAAIHIPCHVIRDYFFAADRRLPWNRQQPLYRLLYLPREVTFGELRLGYRLRRVELKQANASKAAFATLERAYNLLADPQLRAVYDDLLAQPETPVPFPYSGFGSLLVEGEQAKEGGTFFARRIFAFLPERHRRKLTFPLRKLDFFSDYAILRDRNRKLEVLIDQQLLPLKWDQTWSQWRHLITSSIEISADFIRTGKYR